MRITLSVINADMGSIGGHIAPSRSLLETVGAQIAERGRELIIDHCASHTGDDIAIVMTHRQGVGQFAAAQTGASGFAANRADVPAQTTARLPTRRSARVHDLEKPRKGRYRL